MGSIILFVFCIILLFCMILHISMIYGLLVGLLLFLIAGRIQKISWKQLYDAAVAGILTVKNILIAFLLIGMMTASWRASGTIAAIVCYSIPYITPDWFLVLTFFLNCLISFLTGTAFGSAATMGVICAAIGSALGISPVLTGGAVLSGVFFGDRCSPVSTSALLIAELTKTDIYQNIKAMLRTAAVPFAASSVIYLIIGTVHKGNGSIPDLITMFGKSFRISYLTLLPAAVIIVFALLKVKVKTAMTASILAAVFVCIFLQHMPLDTLFHTLVFGYQCDNEALSALIDGGGILSMLKVAMIVCISSTYSGIFRETGMLDDIKRLIRRLIDRTSLFFAYICTSALAGMFACNQTLAIMLTHLMLSDTDTDSSKTAIRLENSVVVIAPLVPWSIACGVPLTAIDAPLTSILLACYLYLLPLWSCIMERKKQN